mgnify:CR=1 FL=1
MDIITTGAGIEMLMRWGHFVAGIAWIGLLYYFNFVQTEYFKEAETSAKSDAVKKISPSGIMVVSLGCHGDCYYRRGYYFTERIQYVYGHLYWRSLRHHYVPKCLANYLA